MKLTKPIIIRLEGLPDSRQSQLREGQLNRQEILCRNNRILSALCLRGENSALSDVSIRRRARCGEMNVRRSSGTKPLDRLFEAEGWLPCFKHVKRNFGLWQALRWLTHTFFRVVAHEVHKP